MGFLGRVFGQREGSEDPTSSAAAPSLGHDDFTGAASSSSSANVPKLPEGALPDSLGSFIKPQESSRLYNPYQGLQTIDPRAQTQKQFRIPTQTEFVFQEEASVKRRSTSENMAYYTGIGYLGGALTGGSIGLAQGVLRSDTAVTSRRLMVNRLLNSTGQTGRLAGNTLGVLGLMFALSESGTWYLLDSYVPYSPSWWGTVAAGAVAGGLYRSPRGPKAAVITAGVGGLAATALLGLRQVFPGV